MGTTTPRRSQPLADLLRRLPPAIGLLAAAAVAVLGLVEAVARMGPQVPVLIAAAPVGVYLVSRPDHGLFALVFAVTIFENDPNAVLGFTRPWWEFLPGLPLQPTDLIMGCMAAGVVMHLVRHGWSLHLPTWLLIPVPFLACGLAGGMVIGYLAGADLNTLLNSARVIALVIVTPLLMVTVVDAYGLIERIARFWFVLAASKLLLAVIGWFLGYGRGLGTTRITFYAPTMNYFALVLVLVVLAHRIKWGSGTVTRFQVLAGCAASASLLLALRRSFWIALALGLVLVLLVASGRRGRPWVVLGGCLVVAGAALAFNAGGATNSDNPVLQRTQIRDDAEDQYRFDEQANVFEEIRRKPLTGIGLGIPWEARHPLSTEFGSPGRNYTHVAIFFYWLKLGPFGAIGYLLVIAATVALGARLWRHDKGMTASAGLGIAVAEAGLAVAELTGTFTGAEGRITVAHMLMLGWVAAAVVRLEGRRRESFRSALAQQAAVQHDRVVDHAVER